MGLGYDTLDTETREYDRQLHEGAKRYDREVWGGNEEEPDEDDDNDDD